MEGIRSFFRLKPKKKPFRGQEKAEAKMVQGYYSREKKMLFSPTEQCNKVAKAAVRSWL